MSQPRDQSDRGELSNAMNANFPYDLVAVDLDDTVISQPSTDEVLRLHLIPIEIGSRLVREGLGHGFTLVGCCEQRTFASARDSMLDRYQSRGGERNAVIDKLTSNRLAIARKNGAHGQASSRNRQALLTRSHLNAGEVERLLASAPKIARGDVLCLASAAARILG